MEQKGLVDKLREFANKIHKDKLKGQANYIMMTETQLRKLANELNLSIDETVEYLRSGLIK